MRGHNRSHRTPIANAVTLILSAMASSAALAGNGFTHTGAASTFGGASNGQSAISNGVNPAAIGFDRSRMQGDDDVLASFHLGGGLEYGNVQELFDIYDELSNAIKDTSGGGSGSGGTSNPGLDFGDIDINNPDFDALIARIETEAVRIGALLAVVGAEGYANADIATELPFIFNTDVLGGTVGFNVSYSGSASATGFLEPINFDADTARTELQAAFNLQPGDPATTYDLSGGISITVDPDAETVLGTFDNDSLLATRAAEETQLGVSYSYPLSTGNNSTLYLGTTAKWVRMGLSRVVTRIGDITDAESLYDDIREAKFLQTNQFGMDFGALWVAPHVTLGASVTDAFEPSYKFNAIDTSGFNNPQLAALVDKLQTYEQERQFSLEASLHTDDRTWAISTSFEANPITDPLGEEHQWWSLSAGWHSENFWLPSVRAGYTQNQVGSEVSLYQLGFTLFRYVDLDLGMTSEKVTIDGSSLPRGARASLGFNMAF